MIFTFESAEAHRLEHLPLAARRALDRAGLKLGLAAWTALSLRMRERLVTLGAEVTVDVDTVHALLAEAGAAPIDRAAPPARPAGVDAHEWKALTPLGRFAVAHHARRGRDAKVRQALRALLGPR